MMITLKAWSKIRMEIETTKMKTVKTRKIKTVMMTTMIFGIEMKMMKAYGWTMINRAALSALQTCRTNTRRRRRI